MNAATYALEPVESLGAEEAGQVRRIYEDGFAPHLRADFTTLTTEREPDEIALALVRDRQPYGFAMLRPLGDTGWIFLRYFVAGQRGQGLGGIMWDRLIARLRADGYLLLIFDVEDPDELGSDPAEVEIRNRRIRFYQRHGAALLPVRGYGNRHEDGGDHEWTPMRLMAAPVAAGTPAPGPEEAPAIVSAVYRYRWRLEPSHPQVAATQVTIGTADQEGS